MTGKIIFVKSKKTMESPNKIFDFDGVEQLSHQRKRSLKSKIKGLKLFKTFQYTTLLIVLATLLIVQIYLCLSKYFSEPTYISSWISDQNDAEFPEITVCPEGGGYKDDVLKQNGFKSSGDYRNTKNHTWQGTNESISSQELFESATYSAEELLKSVYIRSIRGNAEGVFGFYAEIGVDNDVAEWTTQYHRSFGRCHTFFPSKELRSLGIYYMKIYGWQDIKVYLHHPGQWLDLSGRMGYKVFRNESIQMQVTWLYASMLDAKVKTVQKGFKCSREKRYNDCMYQKLYEHMMSGTESKCTVPYLPNNNNICSNEKDRDIAFNTHWNRVTNQEGDCPNPCDFLIINLGGQNRKQIATNTSLLYFYFQSRTTIQEEDLLYTPLSLFAEIGGYVGLLMGFSVFHMADLCSVVTDKKIKQYERILDSGVEEIQSGE